MSKKTSINNLFKKIKLEDAVKGNKSNYDIDFENLLISCHKDDIRGLVNKTFIESKKEKKILMVFKLKLSLK